MTDENILSNPKVTLCACPFLSERHCRDVLIDVGVKIAELRGPSHFMQGKALVGNSHAKLCSHFNVCFSVWGKSVDIQRTLCSFVNRKNLHSWDYLHQHEVCLTVCQYPLQWIMHGASWTTLIGMHIPAYFFKLILSSKVCTSFASHVYLNKKEMNNFDKFGQKSPNNY